MTTENRIKTVSVLGCGWLGFALAKALVSEGAQVQGSTTSPEKLAQLQHAGIEPFLVDLRRERPIPDRFVEVNGLVISIPPKPVDGNYEPFLAQLNRLVSAMETSGPDQVILIGSTAVYPEGIGEATEEMASPYSARAAALLQAEAICSSLSRNRTTVLRLGGLFGPGRDPGRFLAGKVNVPGGSAPVNLIHQADAVALIKLLIEKEITGQTFHACADGHPTRELFYTRAAAFAGLPAPQFSSSGKAGFTLLNSAKIRHALGYGFQYPDPLLALGSLQKPETNS